MIKQKSLDDLISKTLSGITCFHEVTNTDRHLVLFTMYMGDGGFINTGNPTTHGMISWTYAQFEEFVHEKLILDDRVCNDINNLCLVDVKNDNIEDLYDALAYNMAFQIMVVWSFYHINIPEMPRDIDEVKKAYFAVWPGASDMDKSSAMDTIKGWLV